MFRRCVLTRLKSESQKTILPPHTPLPPVKHSLKHACLPHLSSAHEGPGQTLDHKRVTAHQRGMLQQASATQAMLHRQLLQHQIRPELVAPFIPQADMPSLFIPQKAALTSHQRRLRSHIQEAQPDAGISSNISIPPPPGGPASTVAFAVGPHIPAASTQIRFVGRAGMTLLLNKPL